MLEVRGLSKSYNGVTALQEVSFSVKPFEVLGYLGPNGSGKSTTAKILAGLLEPSFGQVFFDGKNIRHHLIDYKRRLGYVPEEPFLYSYLTGREYLQLVGRLRQMPSGPLDRKIDDLLELFSLRRERNSALSSYSKGMRQKILIAAALLHNPDVLIFDEPLSGLDVSSALVFRSLVRSLAARGKIILYSSHVLEVVEKVCSAVVILHRGRVAANGSVNQLRDLMKLPSLEDIFTQLVSQQDTDRVAGDIVGVMERGA